MRKVDANRPDRSVCWPEGILRVPIVSATKADVSWLRECLADEVM